MSSQQQKKKKGAKGTPAPAAAPAPTEKEEEKEDDKLDVVNGDQEEHPVPSTNDEHAQPGPAGTDFGDAMALARQLRQLQLVTGLGNNLPIRDLEAARAKHFAFWDTQPVPKIDEDIVEENGPIEADIPIDQVRSEPYSLPDLFQWKDVDLNDDAQLHELYTLLTENYVEDDDNMFRFDYSPAFLKWALQIPGWLPQWHCGVRAKTTGKLVAFISAVPQTVRIIDVEKKMVEINFLCVHKKLRSKRVAPVLIREITRRVNQTGIFQAAFTAGVVIPKPVSICRYWHRTLNPKKLVESRFSHIPRNMTLARMIKLYKVPDLVKSEGLRPLMKKDIGAACTLLNNHLKSFKLSPHFSKKEFEHIFLPREGVVYSFVVETGGKVTDFLSFYSLPSSIMNHPTHKTIVAAYSYYNVAKTVPLKQLMNDALILASQLGFDVFNALDLMTNIECLEELKFGIGDGNLQYYLYNWKCPSMKPEEIGLVLQ